jgi:hypothetical protein
VHGFIICFHCGENPYGDEVEMPSEETLEKREAETQKVGRKLQVNLDTSIFVKTLPRGDHRSATSKNRRQAIKLEKSAKDLGWSSYRHRWEGDRQVYPDGKTFREQMESQGRQADWVEYHLWAEDTEAGREAQEKRKWFGNRWISERKKERSEWQAMPADQRPLHPEYRGKKDWKWTEPAQKAAAALLLAAQVPRGESKDLLSLTLPRRRTAAAAWLAEPIILAENVLVALFIILVTTLAWYGLYRIALDMYNSAVGWFRRDRKAAELVMIEAPKELRTVGVQAQCHYSWYDADPRFRAHQNGFRRSGEVTVADE